MKFELKRRHKYVVFVLPLYWIGIFIATHIPTIPDWMVNNRMSDNTLHFLCYFVLTFLLWTAISPYEKVNWRRIKPWLVIGIIAAYSGFDEYSQGFVGRGVEFSDFIADITATATCLLIMSLFSFWWACLANTCLCVFIITNLSKVSTLGQNVFINSAFHFIVYALITILWIHCTAKPVQNKREIINWLGKAILFPAFYLIVVKGITIFSEKTVYAVDFYTSATAILLTALTSCFTGLFTTRLLPAIFKNKYRKNSK